jgi:hypothetical protein
MAIIIEKFSFAPKTDYIPGILFDEGTYSIKKRSALSGNMKYPQWYYRYTYDN